MSNERTSKCDCHGLPLENFSFRVGDKLYCKRGYADLKKKESEQP